MAIDLNDIQNKKKKKATSEFSIKNILQKDISFGNNKLPDKKKENFYSQMAMLLDAGIDLKNAFELFIDELKKDKSLPLFTKLNNDLINGISLFDTMMQSNKFTKYDCYNIKIAEETGQLNLILNKLAGYYNRRLKHRKQIISSLIYPVMVIITAILAVIFMMKFIVPMFSNIYSRANMDLPAITNFVVNISQYFGRFAIIIVILIIAFIIINSRLKSNNTYRKIKYRIIDKIPFVGGFLKIMYIEKLFNSLEILSHARVNVTDSLQLLTQMIGYYPLEVALDSIRQNIFRGHLLYEGFAEHKIFESKVVSLIKVGEEANKLNVIFSKLSEQYSSEIESRLNVLQSLLEPLLILIVGGLVGVILVSMYLPLFKMGNTLY